MLGGLEPTHARHVNVHVDDVKVLRVALEDGLLAIVHLLACINL